MTIGDLLSIRWRERAGLLSYIEAIIRSDGRVSAAWVSGSTARGEDDALSDLDLYIVVADNAIDDFVDNRRVHAARPARPVLLMENLANAPTGGAYLLALYEGEAGPQHVDWFWLPESEARLPDQATVLFDRAGLSRESSTSGTMHRPSGPPLGPNPPLADLLEHKIAFFWAMSVIVAKHIARRNGETVARMTRVVAGDAGGGCGPVRLQCVAPGGTRSDGCRPRSSLRAGAATGTQGVRRTCGRVRGPTRRSRCCHTHRSGEGRFANSSSSPKPWRPEMHACSAVTPDRIAN